MADGVRFFPALALSFPSLVVFRPRALVARATLPLSVPRHHLPASHCRPCSICVLCAAWPPSSVRYGGGEAAREGGAVGPVYIAPRILPALGFCASYSHFAIIAGIWLGSHFPSHAGRSTHPALFPAGQRLAISSSGSPHTQYLAPEVHPAAHSAPLDRFGCKSARPPL